MHGLEVHPLSSHSGGLVVLGHHPTEALGVTQRLGHDALPIALCFFDQTLGRTARPGNDIVGIGLALVLEPLGILRRLNGIAESRLNLFWWLNVLNRDIHDGDSRLISIGDSLRNVEGLAANGLFVLIENGITETAAHHFTHGGLGRLLNDVIGAHVVKQIGLGLPNPVLHRELNVDHVLVFGEHERVSALSGPLTTVAHCGLPKLGHIHEFVGLNWIRCTPLESSPGAVGVLAKTQNEAGLAFLNNIEATGEPNEEKAAEDHAHQSARELDGRKATATTRSAPVAAATIVSTPGIARAVAATALATTEESAQASVEISPDLIEVGGLVTATTGATVVVVIRGLLAPLRLGPGLIATIALGIARIGSLAPTGVTQRKNLCQAIESETAEAVPQSLNNLHSLLNR